MSKKKDTFNQPLVEDIEKLPVKDWHRFFKHTDGRSSQWDKRLVQRFLGFKWNPDAKYFVAEIIITFRPMGLMLWDCPPRTYMQQTLVGNQLQIVANWEPIPAELFTMAKSFEQVAKLIDEGIELPGWPDFDAAEIGNRIRIHLSDENGQPVGPPTRVAMWGIAVQY